MTIQGHITKLTKLVEQCDNPKPFESDETFSKKYKKFIPYYNEGGLDEELCCAVVLGISDETRGKLAAIFLAIQCYEEVQDRDALKDFSTRGATPEQLREMADYMEEVNQAFSLPYDDREAEVHRLLVRTRKNIALDVAFACAIVADWLVVDELACVTSALDPTIPLPLREGAI